MIEKQAFLDLPILLISDEQLIDVLDMLEVVQEFLFIEAMWVVIMSSGIEKEILVCKRLDCYNMLRMDSTKLFTVMTYKFACPFAA